MLTVKDLHGRCQVWTCDLRQRKVPKGIRSVGECQPDGMGRIVVKEREHCLGVIKN